MILYCTNKSKLNCKHDTNKHIYKVKFGGTDLSCSVRVLEVGRITKRCLLPGKMYRDERSFRMVRGRHESILSTVDVVRETHEVQHHARCAGKVVGLGVQGKLERVPLVPEFVRFGGNKVRCPVVVADDDTGDVMSGLVHDEVVSCIEMPLTFETNRFRWYR